MYYLQNSTATQIYAHMYIENCSIRNEKWYHIIDRLNENQQQLYQLTVHQRGGDNSKFKQVLLVTQTTNCNFQKPIES